MSQRRNKVEHYFFSDRSDLRRVGWSLKSTRLVRQIQFLSVFSLNNRGTVVNRKKRKKDIRDIKDFVELFLRRTHVGKKFKYYR